jgi:phosphatidylglycerol---prolipoprotein diacylglyceryl transferase
MYPILFHVGRFTMHSFGLMMAIAFLSAGIVGHWQFRKRGVKPDFIYWVLIFAIGGGLLGAKIHYLILHPSEFPGNFFSGSGLVWFGGLFGAIIAVIAVTLISKKSVAAVMDTAAPGVALGYVFGRIGCFLNGDDYGVPTKLPWGMSFPKGSPPTTQTVHPTQLYEAFASLVIFALIVWVISPRLKRHGSLIFSYLIFAGVERFLVEFVRTNKPVLLSLTQQQWISIALFVIGVVGVWWFERHGRVIQTMMPARSRSGAPVRVRAAAKAAPKGAPRSAAKASAKAKTRAPRVTR